MRAILIDAKQRIIREIDLKPDAKNDLIIALRSEIGCRKERVVPFGSHDLWVDEEGKLKDLTYGFLVDHDPYHGNGLILSSGSEGESIAASVDVAVVRKAVKFWGTPA